MTQTTESRGAKRPSWMLLAIAGCLLIAVFALLLPGPKRAADKQPTAGQLINNSEPKPSPQIATLPPLRSRSAPVGAAPAEPAEKIVARKARQYGHLQHDRFYTLVKKRNLKVPQEVDRFFEAAESGDWERLEASFKKLSAVAPQRDKKPGEADRLWGQEPRPNPDDLGELWSSINATFGPLQQTHLWPAQEYLDYGNAILDSLRPGMVYVGGTDPGRFIPELMSATSDEPHIVVTQNALADGSYLNYLTEIYGDKMALPSHEDSQRAFDQYTADARARLLHDQQFPDQPPQLQPGENVTVDDQGKVSVSGQVAVMKINELILQDILKKNPDMSFGLEESFPLKATYPDAAPLGPITELRAQGGQDALTAETAGQSLDYWKDRVQQLLADPAASGTPEWMKAYGKMIDAQANLFTAHGLNDQAEQAFRLSLQVTPGNPEAVFGYTNLLVQEDRGQDALAVARSAAQAHPENQQFQGLVAKLQTTAKQ